MIQIVADHAADGEKSITANVHVGDGDPFKVLLELAGAASIAIQMIATRHKSDPAQLGKIVSDWITATCKGMGVTPDALFELAARSQQQAGGKA